VTVLSRCLKFNLKRLLPEQISGQMRHILAAENIGYEDAAIIELARGADGSLRDGLSLLDQAIAYGGGALKADEVRAMLGSVARDQVLGVLDALAAGDGARLLEECARIASFAPDFGGVLDDLATALHRVQLIQLVPGYRAADADADDAAVSAELAARFAPEDVQLYYQIATTGRRDLPLAPDARSGFEMTLLRMLAFRPAENDTREPRASSTKPASVVATKPARPSAAPAVAAGSTAAKASAVLAVPTTAAPAEKPPAASAPASSSSSPASAKIAQDANGSPDWEALIEAAGLRGPIGQLARNAALRERDGQTLVLTLKQAHMHLAVEPMVSQMAERIGQAMGERVRLRFVADEGEAQTPATRAANVRESAQAAAEQAIADDPLVQSLKREFGARVLPQSVKPIGP
jgi:DNA polymerase-3 subunit gamma/tau